MTKSESSRIDLETSSLRFFICLFDCRCHRTTCEQLGLTGSKGSRILNELREHFGDVLFVRFGASMHPTAKAISLYPKIRELVSSFDSLTEEHIFDPVTLKRTFKIAMTDNAVACFLADILDEFYSKAPQASIEVVPVTKSVASDIKSGACDLLIYPWRKEFADLHGRPLFGKKYVVLVNKKHPLVDIHKKKGKIGLPDLLIYRQIKTTIPIASHYGNTTDMYSLGQEITQRSDSPILTPYFLSVPLFLTNTKLYAVIPEPVADLFLSSSSHLRKLPMPANAHEGKSAMLFWGDKGVSDPALQWLRSLLLSTGAKNGVPRFKK